MDSQTPSQQVEHIIELHGRWKAALLTQLRAVITSADHHIIKEVKWKMPTRPEGLPAWVVNGTICFAEIWKDNIKLLFPRNPDSSMRRLQQTPSICRQSLHST